MSERKIVVTLKAGPGYEAPWLTIGGDTIEEVNFQLDQLAASNVAAKMVAISADIRADYKDARHIEQQQAAQPQAHTQQVGPAAQPAPPQHGGWGGQATATGASAGGYASAGGGGGGGAGYFSDGTPVPEAPGGDPWAQQAAPADPWGQPHAAPAPVQQAPQGGSTPTCKFCQQPMAFKPDLGKKGAWRCPSWRWREGNPTPDHEQRWVN